MSSSDAAIDAFQTDVVALKTLRQGQIIVERETILRGALYIAELLQVTLLATCCTSFGTRHVLHGYLCRVWVDRDHDIYDQSLVVLQKTPVVA